MHRKKITHRDMKPQNVLIGTMDGRPVDPMKMLKWADFGFSKETLTKSDGLVSDTAGGTFVWMAPEQLNKIWHKLVEKNKAHITIQSDLFSAGCVYLYVLKRGNHPYGENSLEITRKLLESDASEQPNKHGM